MDSTLIIRLLSGEYKEEKEGSIPVRELTRGIWSGSRTRREDEGKHYVENDLQGIGGGGGEEATREAGTLVFDLT